LSEASKLTAAGPDRRDRLSQQGGGLRPAAQSLGQTTLKIAADPKHLGAHIGITAVLHTWGSAA
jgi:hypothetical protein